jgi:RNA polymerase sigma-70 factor, ECF subfamily
MDELTSGDVTVLLRQAAKGDNQAASALAPMVMHELKAIAERAMRRERAGHTLQPTLLADEAFVRLVGPAGGAGWENRAHFFAIAASSMRRLLVDHARSRSRQKRGGDAERVPLENVDAGDGSLSDVELLALDEALAKLETLDARQARIVELKFFAGLTSSEIAQVLSVSVRSVDGDWAMARAWLKSQLVR